MKKIIIITIVFLLCAQGWSQAVDGQACPSIVSVTDADGNLYHSVQIGSQCWMRENLYVLHYDNGESVSPVAFPGNRKQNIAQYGVLYDWSAVSSGVCPKGWHVPSDAEWTALTEYLSNTPAYSCGGKPNNIAKSLASDSNWIAKTNTCTICNNPAANNATGFSALPAGGFDHGFGDFVKYWSSTSCYGLEAYCRVLNGDGTGVTRTIESQSDMMSVRCIYDGNNVDDGVPAPVHPDEVTDIAQVDQTNGGSQPEDLTQKKAENKRLSDECISVEDYDGNIYPLVMIGTQCWMAANLRTTHFPNGVSIDVESQTSEDIWYQAYRYYPLGKSESVKEYGFFYSWSAAMNNAESTKSSKRDAGPMPTFGPSLINYMSKGSASSMSADEKVQGICPDGWHLPSDAEWKQLVDYVGSQVQFWYRDQNGKAKRNTAKALASQMGWREEQKAGTPGNSPSDNNATGFNAQPLGYFFISTTWSFGSYSYFWTSTECQKYMAWIYSIGYNATEMKHKRMVGGGYSSKAAALPVRCVRD